MSPQYTVAKRQAIGQAYWDAFVLSCDEAWLWHCYAVQDAIATWPGKRDASIAVLERASGAIVAVLPLHRIERRAAKLVPVSVLDSVGGPALRNGLGERARSRLLQFLRGALEASAQVTGTLDVRLALSPMAPAYRGDCCPRVNPLLQFGCLNTLSQTWLVDLRGGVDACWAKMEGRARTAVRKAQKIGVTVRQAARPEDLDSYYRLHCETYRRTGVSPHPRAYFEAIWRDFLATGLARIWVAEIDGEVVAAENFGVFKDAAIYWTGASSQRGLAVDASSLLQWTAMQWMAASGIQWCETGEAFPGIAQGKSKGLNDFKKSFGGDLYPYYRGVLPCVGVLPRLYRLARAI